MSLDEYEAEARARAWSLAAQGKLPNPPHLRRKGQPDIVERLYPMTEGEMVELRRLNHALAAATDADTFVALVKGREVHESRLSPEHIRLLRLEEGRDG